MEPTTTADVNARLADRLRELRAAHGLTLEALAVRSGVSRSMISLIERGVSSPTAAVLDRLAAGLGVTLASLFAGEARPDASPLSRRADQERWRDPETGYVRRNLSPPGYPSPIELVEVELPAGARVSYDSPPRAVTGGYSQQIWIIDGEIRLRQGDVTHELHAGDCLAMPIEGPISFHNPATRGARYIVALAARSANAAANQRRSVR